MNCSQSSQIVVNHGKSYKTIKLLLKHMFTNHGKSHKTSILKTIKLLWKLTYSQIIMNHDKLLRIIMNCCKSRQILQDFILKTIKLLWKLTYLRIMANRIELVLKTLTYFGNIHESFVTNHGEMPRNIVKCHEISCIMANCHESWQIVVNRVEIYLIF